MLTNVRHVECASSMHRSLSTAVLLLACGFVTSCLPRPSPECRSFYDLSPEQRKMRIRASTTEEQLVLYECGMYQEPPTDFAPDVAEGGENIISGVLDRLRVETSDTRQDHLIHIFEELARKGHLRGRREVADQLRQVASKMKDVDVKSASQQRLRVIENNL